jgi:hypothetical protein
MPRVNNPGPLFRARPSARAQEGQSSPATTCVVPGFPYFRSVVRYCVSTVCDLTRELFSAVARHGKRRSSAARAWTADSPKRRAQRLSQSSLSRKNFQSLTTPCLTNRNGTGDWNGRKLAL